MGIFKSGLSSGRHNHVRTSRPTVANARRSGGTIQGEMTACAQRLWSKADVVERLKFEQEHAWRWRSCIVAAGVCGDKAHIMQMHAIPTLCHASDAAIRSSRRLSLDKRRDADRRARRYAPGEDVGRGDELAGREPQQG